jgi:hypothetical protein
MLLYRRIFPRGICCYVSKGCRNLSWGWYIGIFPWNMLPFLRRFRNLSPGYADLSCGDLGVFPTNLTLFLIGVQVSLPREMLLCLRGQTEIFSWAQETTSIFFTILQRYLSGPRTTVLQFWRVDRRVLAPAMLYFIVTFYQLFTDVCVVWDGLILNTLSWPFVIEHFAPVTPLLNVVCEENLKERKVVSTGIQHT